MVQVPKTEEVYPRIKKWNSNRMQFIIQEFIPKKMLMVFKLHYMIRRLDSMFSKL